MLFAGVCFSVHAIDSFALPEDPRILERYQSLSEEFRCLVCQNQNLADSNAELAVDLKLEVIRLLEDGKSDDQIRDFLTDRYGDFVLYRPPLRLATLLLWFGPLAVALIGVLTIVRRRQPNTLEEPSPDASSSAFDSDEYLALLRGNHDQKPKD